jgi:hypothetical protein
MTASVDPMMASWLLLVDGDAGVSDTVSVGWAWPARASNALLDLGGYSKGAHWMANVGTSD